MGVLFGKRRIGRALLLAVAFSATIVTTGFAEEAPPREEIPSWVNWLNGGLPFDFKLTGLDVEGGYRDMDGRRSSAKFQEYRVFEESPFLDHLRLSLETKDKKTLHRLYRDRQLQTGSELPVSNRAVRRL